MQTKPFTLVVCPECGVIFAVPKIEKFEYLRCKVCKTISPGKDCYKLGLKKIEETGEEVWVGVKDE